MAPPAKPKREALATLADLVETSGVSDKRPPAVQDGDRKRGPKLAKPKSNFVRALELECTAGHGGMAKHSARPAMSCVQHKLMTPVLGTRQASATPRSTGACLC